MEERAKTLYRAGAGSRTSPRSRSRRLGLLAIALGVILVLIIGACIGPLRDYRHSLGALQLKDRDIAKLTTENKAMEAEVARLGDKTHLEALARRDLDYTRPGEELLIVKRVDGSLKPTTTRKSASTPPTGFMERLSAFARRLL